MAKPCTSSRAKKRGSSHALFSASRRAGSRSWRVISLPSLVRAAISRMMRTKSAGENSAGMSLPRPLRSTQMVDFVDRPHAERPIAEIQLVDRARLSLEEPVARKRQFQHAQQDHPVDAVVTDEDDG